MVTLGQGDSLPRVLFVGAFPPPESRVFGGMVSSCRVLLQSSFSERLDLVLVDSTQISNPAPTIFMRALLAARRIFQYFVKFERTKPDAILLFTSVGASVVEKGAMAWYARVRGVPAIIFPRGGVLIESCRESRFTRTWVRIALRGARTMLCQGPAWQRFAVHQMGFDESRAIIVSNWTATPELFAVGRGRRVAGAAKLVQFVFVGWLERKKGVFELLEACRSLARSYNFKLNIVGDGAASDSAREFVRDHCLESTVTFSGWLEGGGLLQAYADADALVLPSWAEGLPNAMIEGMAAKLAVIVSSVGNIPDAVKDGREALLVPPRDVPSLEAALERVITDPCLRERLAGAAMSRAEQEFSVDKAADSLVSVIQKNIIWSRSATDGP